MEKGGTIGRPFQSIMHNKTHVLSIIGTRLWIIDYLDNLRNRFVTPVCHIPVNRVDKVVRFAGIVTKKILNADYRVCLVRSGASCAQPL